MDRDPAFAAGRRDRNPGSDAVRHRAGVCAGAAQFLGQVDSRRACASAPGAAAGRHGLSAAARARPARADWRVACGSSRHRVRLPLDRCGTRLWRDVVSAPGAPDPPVDRGDRPPARAGIQHAWCCAVAGVCDRDHAVGAARHSGRHGARLCQGDRRVRCDHYLRVEYSRRDADDLLGRLLADPDARWRCRRDAARDYFDRHRNGRTDWVGMVRTARDATAAWELSMLRVDIKKQLGEFSLEAAFESEGRVIGLFGASGAGKTSLINMIAGLLPPDRGIIALDDEILDDTAKGVHVPPHRRRIGYVFQDARLFPHLSIGQNLDYGRRMNRLPDDAVQKKRVTDLLDVGHLLDRRPGKLSGGERQRVALGRALLSKPRLLLLDEPLGSLDEGRKVEILPYLVRLRDEANVPMVYVSHDAAEMRQVATQIVMLRDGRVTALGGVKVLTGTARQ